VDKYGKPVVVKCPFCSLGILLSRRVVYDCEIYQGWDTTDSWGKGIINCTDEDRENLRKNKPEKGLF